MANLNEVNLIGRLGRDPEVRYSAEGNAICNVSVATNHRVKDKSSGQYVDDTEWHRVVLHKQQAEFAGEYLRKGQEVYVKGTLRSRKWTDNSGQEKYSLEIIASSIQPTGPRQNNEGGGHAADAPDARPQRSPQPSGGVSDMDDDIPFAPCWRGVASYCV